MRIRPTFLISLLLFLASFMASAHAASSWLVLKVSQPTYYSHAGKAWKQVNKGMRLPNGVWINTKRRGRVMLKRGGDVVLINSNAMTGITGSRSQYGKVRIQHRKGQINLAIKKGRKNRVFVNTPHLAGVVKGTTFSVTTDNRKSTLSVSQGLVGVTDSASGQRANVGVGQNVSSAVGQTGFSSTTGTSPATASQNPNGPSNSKGNKDGNGNGSGNNGNGNGKGGGNNGNANGGGNGYGDDNDDGDDGDDGDDD